MTFNLYGTWAVYRFEGLTGKRPQTLNTLGSVGGLEQQYYIGIAPVFDPVRNHPRFQALLMRLKLPQ